MAGDFGFEGVVEVVVVVAEEVEDKEDDDDAGAGCEVVENVDDHAEGALEVEQGADAVVVVVAAVDVEEVVVVVAVVVAVVVVVDMLEVVAAVAVAIVAITAVDFFDTVDRVRAAAAAELVVENDAVDRITGWMRDATGMLGLRRQRRDCVDAIAKLMDEPAASV
jgi:hypothetical protein